MIRRLFTRSRLKEARQRVAKEPTPANFVHYAYECVVHGDFAQAKRVVDEGLQQFPRSSELLSAAERVTKQAREARLAVIKSELRDAPRDGLHQEQVELLLEGDLLERAMEAAERWRSESDGLESRLCVARVLAARLLADRGRSVGERAFAAIDAVEELSNVDPRSWRLRMELSAAIGAWVEARRAAARLLELEPGDPDLEALFRTYDARSGEALEIRDALIEVERSGRLFEEPRADATRAQTSLTRDVRPALRVLAHEPGVRAALYLRGATALVQGPKGATAERTARQVRETVQSTRTLARRLGLGLVEEFQFEGGFGSLLVSTTESDAAALWTTDPVTAAHRHSLSDLSGMTARSEEGTSR